MAAIHHHPRRQTVFLQRRRRRLDRLGMEVGALFATPQHQVPIRVAGGGHDGGAAVFVDA